MMMIIIINLFLFFFSTWSLRGGGRKIQEESNQLDKKWQRGMMGSEEGSRLCLLLLGRKQEGKGTRLLSLCSPTAGPHTPLRNPADLFSTPKY